MHISLRCLLPLCPCHKPPDSDTLPTVSDVPAELAQPHPVRLFPGGPRYDEIMAAHDAAMAAGRDGYADPTSGLFVMTAGYLWDRSYCCDSGCRHCPYLER